MNPLFNRSALHVKPLAERVNKLDIRRDMLRPETFQPAPGNAAMSGIRRAAFDIRAARKRNAPVVLAFGAHTIKNGLSRVMIRLLQKGWATHFATNGAGVIHDWEFAYQGRSGEDVQRYATEGQFGIWQETGAYINLAIAVGARKGLGYGESIGAMMANDGLAIPSPGELRADLADAQNLERAAASADLLAVLLRAKNISSFLPIPHPFKAYSLQAAAYAARVPFTAHPMFGHDIIYTHPLNSGAAIGRAAERDFLSFTHSISGLQNGVYLSIGSAVMSPMIFEKALSMARNLAHAKGTAINNFALHVVDLAQISWDWQRDGEPPQDNPAYYLRFCKTFARMGGRLTYTSCDNRHYLAALLHELETNP